MVEGYIPNIATPYNQEAYRLCWWRAFLVASACEHAFRFPSNLYPLVVFAPKLDAARKCADYFSYGVFLRVLEVKDGGASAHPCWTRTKWVESEERCWLCRRQVAMHVCTSSCQPFVFCPWVKQSSTFGCKAPICSTDWRTPQHQAYRYAVKVVPCTHTTTPQLYGLSL